MLYYKIILTALLFSLMHCVEGQEYYYYNKDKKTQLKPDYSELYIVAKSKFDNIIHENIKNRFSGSTVEVIKNSVYKIKNKKYANIYNKIKSEQDVLNCYPSHYYIGDNVVSTTNQLICIPNGVSIGKILTELSAYDPSVDESFNVGYGTKYLISVDYAYNIVDVANFLHESGLVLFAQPCFIHEIELNETDSQEKEEMPESVADCLEDPYFEPNDSYYWGKQWYLKRCEAIRAPYAWDITQGSSSVVVAILDQGFDLQHPEFSGKYFGQYDAINNNSSVTANCVENHGSRVAGIISAVTNNSSGIASIGINTKFIPIRIIFKNTSSPFIETLNESDLIRAEQYLINNYINANIVAVNCSWKIAQTPNVESVLQNLRDNLRGGKGASMVFCSGNEGTILYGTPPVHNIHCL